LTGFLVWLLGGVGGNEGKCRFPVEMKAKGASWKAKVLSGKAKVLDGKTATRRSDLRLGAGCGLGRGGAECGGDDGGQ
jgi:hypothetical protein